ncbi:MAG: protein kinase [Nannocystaceae bacterium]|nr:protein kinase [Nannocystaceae bacterium]
MHPSDQSTHVTGLRRRGPTAAGEIVGGYELLREIGRGGMAEVWVARKAGSSAGKFVAIKMILPHYCGDERYSRMFATEAQVASPLSHSNIVQVFDEGEDHGRSYLVMEWVDGTDLSRFEPLMLELQQRDPYLRLRATAYIVGQVLHGLGYAHALSDHDGQQLGIVHRDISPHNVLVSVSGDVKVTDFGIAHRMIDETAGVDVKGKLRYMPTEQLAGRSHAPTVDLFAVGAILHELLDGRRFRHDADDHIALYHSVISGRVPELSVTDVPPELEALRVALLQPEARDRPQSAEQALVMLKRWSGYAEMKTELAALCQQVTGVARPRTGPMLQAAAPRPTVSASAPSQPSVAAPPRELTRTSALTHESEPDAPRAPWGVSSSRATGAAAEPGTALLDPQEQAFARGRPRSEPTEALDLVAAGADRGPTTSPDLASSTGVGAWPPSMQAETTVSQIDLARDEPRRRGWMLFAALGLCAAVGIGTAVALLVPGDEPAAAVASAPASKPATPPTPEPTVAVAGPSLAPVRAQPSDKPAPSEPPAEPAIANTPAVAAPTAATPAVDDTKAAAPSEPTPAPASEPTPSKPTAPSKPPASKSPSSKPPASKPPSSKPEPESPAGPPVLVHFRLESGLAGADVRIAGRIVSVRPHYDTKIPSGRHAVKWRANVGDAWSSAGTVELGDSGEWKLFVGPSGAKLSRF